jgi:hypothetical protein
MGKPKKNPLVSYDVLIGMDWLESDRVKLDCYNKFFYCIDEFGNSTIIKGILKEISIKHILAL